jgi:hypothetical protein
MSTYTTSQKPSLVTAIAIMTLVSGIVNIFWGLIASMTALATIVGFVCTPFTILPTILGIFEIIYAARLIGNPVLPTRPSNLIAAFEIACILAGNAFSMIVGILALVFYNDQVVKTWFDGLNSVSAPAEPAPVEPALPQPEPARPEAPAEPSEPETPAKPSGPRKVA